MPIIPARPVAAPLVVVAWPFPARPVFAARVRIIRGVTGPITLLIHVPAAFGVIVAKPRSNLVARPVHVAAIVGVVAITTLIASTITVFVTFCHVELLNNQN
jgi:hypothetical protein